MCSWDKTLMQKWCQKSNQEKSPKPNNPNPQIKKSTAFQSLTVCLWHAYQLPFINSSSSSDSGFSRQGLIMIFVKGMLTLHELLFLGFVGYSLVEWDEWLICSLMTAVCFWAGPLSAVITVITQGHQILTLSWYVGEFKFCHRYQI